MANSRLFWAVKAVALAPYGSTAYVAAKGVQSVGVTLDFNLVQAFELGQLSIYENIEQVPDVSVTIEKLLDGTALLYFLATRGAPSATLAGRSAQRAQVALSLFDSTNTAASGAQLGEVTMSGMYLSSLNYNFNVTDNFSESVTLVGNNRTWRSSAFQFTGGFTNLDIPVFASGGVNRKEDFIWAGGGAGATLDVNGQCNATNFTVLPPDLPGITSSGTNNVNTDGSYPCSVQSISVSADLGRDAIYELGHKAPYFRYVTFPVEVTTEITIVSKSGDFVQGTDTGILTGVNAGNNLSNRSIRVAVREGTFLDMGLSNKLTSVSENGGDTGGGNEELTFKFVTYNDLTVTNPNSPG